MMFRIFRFLTRMLSEELTDENDFKKVYSNQNDSSSTSFHVVQVPGKYYEKEERKITGKVTHIYESYGLVDGYVYFDSKCVKSKNALKVDDPVEVVAVRQARQSGWRALSVEAMSDDWDSIREVYQTSGAVTNMTGERSGTVDYKYNFIANHCQDYDPWKGDRVLVTLASNGYTEVVEALHPFAPQKYSGKVVHVGQRYCFIDGNIAFTRSCCVNRYTPCRGDLVSGQMIECDQGQRWGLRALTVSCNADQPDSTAMEGNSAQGDQLKKINAAYVFIEGNFEFNDVAVGSSDTHTFFIRNGSKNSLELNSLSLNDPVAAQFVISTPKILLEGHHANKALQSAAISLLPGMTACFHVTFRPRYVGRDSLTLLFHFSNLLLKRSIVGTSVAPAEGEKEVNVNRANQQIFRQVRHNISPSDSNRAVMPGTHPQFRYVQFSELHRDAATGRNICWNSLKRESAS